jgi:hypothetical protein
VVARGHRRPPAGRIAPEESSMLDVIYIAGILALVALLALVARAVEKL